MAFPVVTEGTRSNHDVFISFSGSNTRDTFTSHLHAALVREKIHAFIDDTFPRGQDIGPSLFKTIMESEVAVIIFSQSYGGSRWCLNELVEILEYRDRRGMVVLPVFYGVDPSDVDEQKEKFGDEFKKLKEQYMDEGDKWIDALKKAANIGGLVWSNFRSDAMLIEKVVKSVFEELKKRVSSLPANLVGMVGMELHIKNMLHLLQMEKKNVLFLGIWGMGGIGKTTCAEALFNQIVEDFESWYFQADVREESRKHPSGSGFLHLKILGEILNMEKTPNFLSKLDRKRLSQKKVLIILDDVGETEQLETIVGGHNWYGPGSRIIVTSRDKQVLEKGDCVLYEVGCLSNVDALRLFSWHAFKRSSPDASYLKWSKKVVRYAGGVPLALKVLGSLLYVKPPNVWKSYLHKLRSKPERQIGDVFKISYDELDEDQQNMFLDIACFFIGEDKDIVTDVLQGSGFCALSGINCLQKKGLITITDNKCLQMQNLVQEMGREIVSNESDDCEKRSRLWKAEEIIHVLTRNMGNELTQCIVLDPTTIERDVPLSFSSMLRLLKISHKYNLGLSSCCPPYLPSTLSYIQWYNYPWKLLHDDFYPERLVYLKLHGSKIERLWLETKVSPLLKYIDLSNSSNLTWLPDLSSAVNLEKIVLDFCVNLCEIPTSIERLEKILHLSLRSCEKIRILPNLDHLNSLQTLNLSYCSSLEVFPLIGCYTSLLELNLSHTGIKKLPEFLGYFSSLIKLNLSYTGIDELPASTQHLTNLVILDLRDCPRLSTLPSSICELKSLVELILCDCQHLRELPHFGSLSVLQKLSLEGTNIKQIPPSIDQLNLLEELIIRNCKTLQYLPKLPCSVNFVDSTNCFSMMNVAISTFNVFGKPSKLQYRFLFTNCIKLDDRSRENIMCLLGDDQDIETTLRGFSAASECSERPKFMICLPETTIPKWFGYQDKRSYVAADFYDFNYKICSIGLAFGVVVEFSGRNELDNFKVRCMCKFITRSGIVLQRSFEFGDEFCVEACSFTKFHSDHVFIWMVGDLHISKESDEDYLMKATFEFSASYGYDYDLHEFDIKMCGIHVVCFSDKNQCQSTSGGVANHMFLPTKGVIKLAEPNRDVTELEKKNLEISEHWSTLPKSKRAKGFP